MKFASLFNSLPILKKSKNKLFSVFLYFVILTIVLDTSFDRIYYLNFNEYPLNQKVVFFVVISIIAIIGQFDFLQFVRNNITNIIKTNFLYTRTLTKFAYVIQSILTIIFLILLSQIIFELHYNVMLLTISVVLSSLFGISMLTLLALKFFSWFRSRNDLVVLLYGISSSVIAVHIMYTVVVVASLLSTKPDIILPHFGWEYTSSTLGDFYDISLYGLSISSIIGFVIAWISTIFLLRQFSIKWKGNFHWFLIVIPLIYFLIEFQPLFMNLFSQLNVEQPVFYGIIITLFITYSKPIGGLIFGGAFLSITQRLDRNGIKMNYTTISAFGFIILFISNQEFILSSASYPPFGISAINFLGLACFMVLVGIYSTSISISQNTKLRDAIRKLVENRSNLLDSISASQMSQSLEKEVFDIYSSLTNTINEENGITPSLSLPEAKLYCDEIIAELENSRQFQSK